MKTFLPLLAGVFGTACMTIFTAVAFRVLKKNFNVVVILGNMLVWQKYTVLEPTRPFWRYLLAFLVHYGIGIFFAYLYAWILIEGIINLSLTSSILFGLAIGFIAIIGWRTFFALHPGPPMVILKYYLLVIGIGHIVLAITTALTYQFFAPSIAENIPLCQVYSESYLARIS